MESKGFILEQTTIKKLLTIYKLKIPDFQRHFVWKLSKKQQLLDSLFRGFPIGAITLYEDRDVYYIIDGLQRINTLNQYLSRPGDVIRFPVFYEKAEEDVKAFLEKNGMLKESDRVKKCVKIWYEKLNSLYGFEKVSVLYHTLQLEYKDKAGAFGDLQTVEELLDILKDKIEIANDNIALIIYRGDKNDLPELFKNINTGSVALSQYEILQSVWNDYVLDKQLVSDTWDAFNRELELHRNNYEIDAVRDQGTFDIFKNIIGLNHILCCIEASGDLFRFSGFKKLNPPVKESSGQLKYYDNDGIAFELYSTILCRTSNQIVRAVDLIYHDSHDLERISRFVNDLNRIIVDAVKIAAEHIKKAGVEMIDSKYHTLYVLTGIICSRYDVDPENLVVKETDINYAIFRECLDLKRHADNKWFTDENRQIGFFKIKVGEMMDLKRTDQESGQPEESEPKQRKDTLGMLELYVNHQVISARTVKDFYRKIFAWLFEQKVDFDEFIPYATGKKRYLINRTDRHINGSIFVSPLSVGDYYVETHKSKTTALKDMYNFLQVIGVEVEYA